MYAGTMLDPQYLRTTSIFLKILFVLQDIYIINMNAVYINSQINNFIKRSGG